ncbi:NAD(P)/FAD-dependent oxidoreductase [Cupriavidus sp. WS]|uniref:flavin-containing monooxygenase n=1 Tax=Cupriavidus sp. WS TaxID=1312922 RepID=UPI0003721C08|nr:NAD(P)/FAD-dependent oxidoreductase [Cupriavidus sp. WS]
MLAGNADKAHPPAWQAPHEQVHHFDVLIVGAGLSGICAAYHLQTSCPGKRYAILEGRDAIGGTWDLFRYPGVRSDSDMYTLGFSFRPWRSDKSIAAGDAILEYIRDTARTFDIERHIRFGHRATRASWSSETARWTVDAAVGPQGEPARFTCNFLYLCSGHYDYADGYMPGWPGMERFGGRVVHPQHWPEDLVYDDQRVVVIGSGATAVTLLPEMAKRAAHVTMLQRSPTYIVARPSSDAVSAWLRRKLPAGMAHRVTRWKNVLFGMYFYHLARRKPELVKRKILEAARAQLGPDYDVDKHFSPAYKPWDQRLCLVPDSDLFKSIRAGRASVVTDHIESFTETGLQLRSGQKLDADVIVTATGLQLKVAGGMRIEVDGVPADPAQAFMYKGMMYSDVPNLAVAMGYVNASWTLKAELSSMYVCRLINHMEANGHDWCAPRRGHAAGDDEPSLSLTSGYVQRASGILPRQGSKRPWRVHQNYLFDLMALKFGKVEDDAMEFGRAGPAAPRAPATARAAESAHG